MSKPPEPNGSDYEDCVHAVLSPADPQDAHLVSQMERVKFGDLLHVS